MSTAVIMYAVALAAPGDFKALGRDGNGFISAVELRPAMTNRSEKLMYEEIEEAIRVADVDVDVPSTDI